MMMHGQNHIKFASVTLKYVVGHKKVGLSSSCLFDFG